jgi:serine/threonine protein kinase
VLPPGQTIADRYVVERMLARGGMATVYVVRHLQLESLHALKVLDIPTADIRRRMLQEGRIQASLKHPNIVAVTDAIEVDGQPGLVMELVEGPSLSAVIDHERPPLDRAERWFQMILSAVAYAHERGLVHRDLKPDNVLLMPMSGDFLPKVADFGIAKVVQDWLQSRGPGSHTRTGVAMGTPAYMPPEQVVSAGHVDHRADVFALGCILYELVCGRRAFEGENVLSVFNAVAQGKYTPPTEHVPGLPDRIVRAIDGCLVPKVDDRIPDCATLAAVLGDKPLPERPRSRTPPPPLSSTPATKSDPTWADHPAVSAVAQPTPPAPPAPASSAPPTSAPSWVGRPAPAPARPSGTEARPATRTEDAPVVPATRTSSREASGGGCAWLAAMGIGAGGAVAIVGGLVLALFGVVALFATGAVGSYGGADTGEIGAPFGYGHDVGRPDYGWPPDGGPPGFVPPPEVAPWPDLKPGEPSPLVKPRPATPEHHPVWPPQGGTALGYDVSVHGWRTEPPFPGAVAETVGPGMMLYLVDVTVTYRGAQPHDPFFPWDLIGPDGTEYDGNLQCSMFLSPSIDPFASYEPGEVQRGEICFAAPSGLTGLRMRFKPEMSRFDAVTVPLR